MTDTGPPLVVVAMLTYRRPDDLHAALPRLAETVSSCRSPASVLIVDNDPSASAMPLAAAAPDRVRFVHEPTPGIAAARNRALDETGDADLLVFIDDDERPEPGWLDQLVDTWRRDRPAAVVGPVVSTFPSEPEPFIVEGGFFRRRRLPTGTAVDVAATNNLLLDLDQVRRLGVRFDTTLGTAGGSDTLFTRTLHRRGGRLVWCDEAVVVDVVPPGRLTRDWVLRRALRTGNSTSRIGLRLETSTSARAALRVRLTARGGARVLGGALRFVLGVVLGSLRHRANGARTFARGMGMTTGAWGWTYDEYRRRTP
jgi:succinoglycan biosynthesis protein ExoM